MRWTVVCSNHDYSPFLIISVCMVVYVPYFQLSGISLNEFSALVMCCPRGEALKKPPRASVHLNASGAGRSRNILMCVAYKTVFSRSKRWKEIIKTPCELYLLHSLNRHHFLSAVSTLNANFLNTSKLTTFCCKIPTILVSSENDKKTDRREKASKQH